MPKVKPDLPPKTLPTLVLSTEMKTGQRFKFEVVPEVAYHVLQEIHEGAPQVHFEDICEKPVTLSCQHLKSIKVDSDLFSTDEALRFTPVDEAKTDKNGLPFP